MERFRHELWTGSGSDLVVLTLDGATADLNVQTCWMGPGLKRYRLRCGHRALSQSFGVLAVERVEASDGLGVPFAPVSVESEECLCPFVIEYVRVPASPAYVHEGSQLVDMAPLGYAGWNATFEVVLLVNDREGRPEPGPLAEVCNVIDKVKLAAWAGDGDEDEDENEGGRD